MSSIKLTKFDGDLSLGRNLSIGGKTTIQGNSHFKGGLKIDGWLDAPNIKGANKGIFTSVEKLKAEYPFPRNGWYAFVGTSLPAPIYVGDGGNWVDTGGTGGNMTADVQQFQDDFEKLQTDFTDGLSELKNNLYREGSGGYLPWEANKGYTEGDVVVAPDGVLVKCNEAHTSGDSYVSDNWESTSVDNLSKERDSSLESKVSELEDRLSYESNLDFEIVSKNLRNSSGTESSFSRKFAKISCHGLKAIDIDITDKNAAYAGNFWDVEFYDANDTYIQGGLLSNGLTTLQAKVNIPDNCYYMYALCNTDSGGTFSGYQVISGQKIIDGIKDLSNKTQKASSDIGNKEDLFSDFSNLVEAINANHQELADATDMLYVTDSLKFELISKKLKNANGEDSNFDRKFAKIPCHDLLSIDIDITAKNAATANNFLDAEYYGADDTYISPCLKSNGLTTLKTTVDIIPECYYLYVLCDRLDSGTFIGKQSLSNKIDNDLAQMSEGIDAINEEISNLENDSVGVVTNKVIATANNIPIVTFVFDDGLSTDTALVEKLDTRGLKASFSLSGNTDPENIYWKPYVKNMKKWLLNGHGTLAHGVVGGISVTGTGIGDMNDHDQHLAFQKNREVLSGFGFPTRGITYFNTIKYNSHVFSMLGQYYNYGISNSGTGINTLQTPLWRYSRYNTDGASMLTNAIKAVDNVVGKPVWLMLGGHSNRSGQGGSYSSAEDFDKLLDYVAEKVSNNQMIALNADDAFDVMCARKVASNTISELSEEEKYMPTEGMLRIMEGIKYCSKEGEKAEYEMTLTGTPQEGQFTLHLADDTDGTEPESHQQIVIVTTAEDSIDAIYDKIISSVFTSFTVRKYDDKLRLWRDKVGITFKPYIDPDTSGLQSDVSEIKSGTDVVWS